MSRRRSSKPQQGLIVAFVTLIVIICGLFYSLTGIDPGGMFGGSPTPPNTIPVFPTNTPFQPIPSGNTWWQVYFTDPLTVNDPNNYGNSIEQRLIERINAAQISIHIASFEFDLTPVADALIAAHNRGVDVRWVTDDEYGLGVDEDPGHGQFQALKDAGIEVRSDNRTALMHNKFWIFDGQVLWTGSTNVTKSGIFVQNNNTIVFFSPELATIYEREFQEMWDGQFGPKSPSQLAQQSVVVNGMPIEVIFTSEDGALEGHIIPLAARAQFSIRFLAFSFTDYPLAKTMIDRAAAGVSVAGVIDKTQSGGQGSELGTLFCAGIPVRQDGNPQFMHNKLIIVDDRYVVTGSMNFSTSAEESNDENVIIIDNAEIAAQYIKEFDRIWAIALNPNQAQVICQ